MQNGLKKKLTDALPVTINSPLFISGDSKSAGNDRPSEAWPITLAELTGGTLLPGVNSAFGNAHNGWNTRDLITFYAENIAYNAPYYTGRGVISTVFIGSNDPGELGYDAAQSFTQQLAYLSTLRSDGHFSIHFTLPQGLPSSTDYNAFAAALNTLILTQSPADTIFDLASLLPQPPNAYFDADGQHFSLAGNNHIAQLLYAFLTNEFTH